MHYHFTELTFSGGETVPVRQGELLILVGPNNCGKSRALREIELAWRGSTPRPGAISGDLGLRVVLSTKVSYASDWATFSNWAQNNYSVKSEPTTERYFGIGVDLRISPGSQPHDWTDYSDFRGFVISRLSTESRLQITQAPNRVDPSDGRPYHFAHRIQMDADLLKRMQREIREAFGLDLELDYNAGPTIPVIVGELPVMEAGWDRVHPDYARATRKQMMPLQDVGDGVRSYVATIGSALAESQPVLLVDEPEAFLHPPQARRLGKLLGTLAAERQRQIVVATHSSDVVQGALSSGGRVAVCRMERKRRGPGESVNHAYVLDPDRLRSLWEKPLLRSSHTIDGIFHRGVVVCESDSDARFYEAILNRLEVANKLSEPADIHFVHGGGKAELATLARSYQELHVPVAVIADFDLLRNKGDLRRVVEALGGDFGGLERDYNVAASALAKAGPSRTEAEALTALAEQIAEIQRRPPNEKGQRLDPADRRSIRNALADTQDWSEAKRYGIRTLRGEQRQAAERLLEALSGFGLFVVPSGELESWDEALSAGKKEVWIREALTKVPDPESFSDAADFIESVAGYLGLALKH